MKQIIPFKKEITFKTMIRKITSISLEHTLNLKEEDLIIGDFIVSGSYKMTEASQIDEEFSYKVPIEITIDDKYDTTNISLDIDDFVYEVIDEEKLALNISLCIDNLELKKVESIKKPDEATDVISSYDDGYTEIISDLEDIESNLLEESIIRNDKDDLVEEDIMSDETSLDEDLFQETSQPEPLDIPVHIDSINTTKDAITPQTLPYIPPINSVDSNTDKPNNNNETSDSVASIFSAFKNTDETFSTYYIYIIREGDSLDTVLNKYKTTRDILADYNDLSDIRLGSKIIVPSVNE